jgi:hypothetical protein
MQNLNGRQETPPGESGVSHQHTPPNADAETSGPTHSHLDKNSAAKIVLAVNLLSMIFITVACFVWQGAAAKTKWG